MRVSPTSFQNQPGKRSAALVIVLLAVVLLSVVLVALVVSTSLESSISHRDYQSQVARSLALTGLNSSIAQIRTALGPWDDPFNNFSSTNATAAPPTFFWSVSPGIITRWSYTSVAPQTNYPLFSLPAPWDTANPSLVNLNAPTSDGIYPIIGGVGSSGPTNLMVYWANVLQNPTHSPAANNPIIGRYAFWVDDENAKINLNTADGTQKYNNATSLGLGTPSEVSLQILQPDPTTVSPTTTNIIYIARTTGINSPQEIMRASGATPDLYTNNVFNLTCTGRSPDLNIFGEPKINLIPASPPPSPALNPGYLQTNAITTQPLTEIYPTPYQLSPFVETNACAPYVWVVNNFMRPEVMSQEWAITSNGGGAGYLVGAHDYQGDAQGFMMDQISRFLGGTNNLNKAIQWPVFPYPSTPLSTAASSGANGFMGKYSLRQLDTLATQITDMAGKAITPDAPNQLGQGACYPMSVASSHGGLLSHQTVPGLGRSPRINEIYMSVTVNGLILNSDGTPSQTPYITMQLYVETYFPAGFGGVDLLNLNNGLPPVGNFANNWDIGALWFGGWVGDLNEPDWPTDAQGEVFGGVTNLGGGVPPMDGRNYGQIPRLAPQPYAASQPNNYWCDTILQNNVGIDFLGNDAGALDPDQIRAQAYHQGYPTNSSGQYYGTGSASGYACPLLYLGYLSYYTAGQQPWYPGQYRTVSNRYPTASYPMMTNAAAAVTNLVISGGFTINGYGPNFADPIKTPLESTIRGPQVWPLLSYIGEPITSTALAWVDPQLPAPGNTNQTTESTIGPGELLRDRVLKEVIPVNLSVPIPVPVNSGGTGSVASQGWYHAEVADPLVNLFPADWIPSSSTTSASSTYTLGAAMGSLPTMNSDVLGGSYGIYYNDTGQNVSATSATTNSPYYDPDSFFMPTLDPKIPRSARFPNVGYLNYQRTGVIPDNETVDVSLQHGTPYRCLNFNAVNDASQMGAVTPFRSSGYYYPDWALLDLFNVPSTLLPYRGPYGYYNNGTWQAGSLLNGNPAVLYNYGTWGGSTPGRINPNGSVVYSTNVDVPTPGISRTLPLQAVLYGVKINQTIATGISAATATTNAPTFTGGTTLDSGTSAGLASAIANYIGTYGPLREPAEICNIPAISTNYPQDSTHYNPTRNDLVRQIVGNLTTQSNTFSVWVAGESITKSKVNSNYGFYEQGDQIAASVRYHFVVERYLDPGLDGAIGNPTLPTGTAPNGFTLPTEDVDRIVGTYDDPLDPNYHPQNPHYLYRVTYAEEIR